LNGNFASNRKTNIRGGRQSTQEAVSALQRPGPAFRSATPRRDFESCVRSQPSRQSKQSAPVWEGAEYHRCSPGVYEVRCIHIQGPEWLRFHQRWSIRLECMFLDEPDARVSGFLSLGSNPERPHVGRKSRYFDLWCKTNRGLPRKGQEMSWDDFIDKFYRVRVDDSVTDAKGREIPENQRYSKIVEFLECLGP
jgi:hypothetical protein